MRKRILVLLFLVCTFAAFAQEQQTFRLGFKVSPQLTWMNSSSQEISNEDTKLGISYGLTTDFFLGSDKYILSTGFLMSSFRNKMGINTDTTYTLGGTSFTGLNYFDCNLQFIEIPLAVKLRTGEFNRFVYYGEFGASTYFNVKSQATSDDEVIVNKNINEQVKLFTMAMRIGVGAEYDLGSGNSMTLGIQYQNGFINMLDIDNIDDHVSLNNFRFVVGMNF